MNTACVFLRHDSRIIVPCDLKNERFRHTADGSNNPIDTEMNGVMESWLSTCPDNTYNQQAMNASAVTENTCAVEGLECDRHRSGRQGPSPAFILATGILVIILHVFLFYHTTILPDRGVVESGYFQRVADWYVPMSFGDFKNVPPFTRTRWLTPVLAGLLPLNILDAFLLVTCVAITACTVVFLVLLIRLRVPLSGIIAGLIVFLWSYASRYAFHNPLIPDGIRYLTLMLLLAGSLLRNRVAIWIGSVLAAVNHESALMFLPLAVAPFLRCSGWSKKTTTFVWLAGPALAVYAVNWLVLEYRYPSEHGIVFQRFLIDEIRVVLEKQGGVTGVLYLGYSALGPIYLLVLLALVSTPSYWRKYCGFWAVIVFLQLFIACDTLRMIQAFLPLALVIILTGMDRRLQSHPIAWYTMLVITTATHVLKSISRFDTRSTLSPAFLYGIPGDMINLIILIPFLILFLVIFRLPKREQQFQSGRLTAPDH